MEARHHSVEWHRHSMEARRHYAEARLHSTEWPLHSVESRRHFTESREKVARCALDGARAHGHGSAFMSQVAHARDQVLVLHSTTGARQNHIGSAPFDPHHGVKIKRSRLLDAA